MDGQIRLRQPQDMRALPPRPARTTLSLPKRPMNFVFASGAVDAIPDHGNRRFTVVSTEATTANSLRKAILDCALQASRAEPHDSDRRLHSFIAKLSGTMEGLGERELDTVLWNLMATTQTPSAPVAAPSLSDVQLGMTWWNGLTEERRSYWLSKAVSAVPYAAWLAFRRAEDDLAVDG